MLCRRMGTGAVLLLPQWRPGCGFALLCVLLDVLRCNAGGFLCRLRAPTASGLIRLT